MTLPSVYANKIDKEIKNNSDYFYGDREVIKKDLHDLKNKFDNRGYVNRLRVIFKMKDGKTLDEKLVLKKKDCFVTLNNQIIYFDDIVDYEIK